MRKVKSLMGLVCLMGLVIFGINIAQAADITLRFAGNLPVGHHTTKGQELLAKLIEEKTAGKVKVQVFPAGQLFSDKDMMKAVPSGGVDMAEVTTSLWSGMVPSLMILDLPLFFSDRRHFWRTIDGEAGEILKKDLEKVGVKLLHWSDGGSVEFASKKPLRSLQDFKGMRIRIFGELAASSMRDIGAAPAYLGGGEVYMGLQRGTIDGAISVVTAFWDRKFYEVSKYLTDINFFMFVTYGILMNLEKWNALPPDIQKAILACSHEAQEWTRKECEKMDKECLQKFRTKMEVYTWPDTEKQKLRTVNQPTIDLFLTRAGEKGKRLIELAEKAR
jgi:tripartite ATP-independent transporter DctP family solute receptor